MRMHTAPFLLKELKLEVTHNCHLNCVHCSSLAEAECTRQMTWDNCKRVLDEAIEMDVEEIAISGGEPLLWDSLTRAVAYATKRSLKLSLYTSGIAQNAPIIFEQLKDAGLSRIIFSIFGSTQEQHESVTLTEGSFCATLEAVRKCLSQGFNVEFHFVPMLVNYMALRSVAELARELGVNRISALRLVPQGRGAVYENLKLSKNANEALRQMIIELRIEGHDIRVGSPYNILMLKDNPECCAGIDRLTISPDLSISPCDAFKQVTPEMLGVENEFSCLNNHSLSDCWEKSIYLKKIREYLTTPFAEKCNDCNMLKYCLSGCVAQKFYFYREMAKRPDPMCLAC